MSLSSLIPLSPDELTELDDFLLMNPEERLSIDEAHGFITALIVARDMREPAAWLPDVWGDTPFTNVAEERRLTDLVLRMRDDIAEMLADGEGFEPLIIEEEDEDEGELYEAHEGWCFGFMLAVANDEERWRDLPNDQKTLLEPIAALALLHSEEEPDMTEEEYEGWVELLPGAVMGLQTYFSARTN